MTDDRGTIRAIDWAETFPSLRLLAALRIALNFKALLLAALGLAGTVAGWRALDSLFVEHEGPALDAHLEIYRPWPWEHSLHPTPLTQFTSPSTWLSQSPLLTVWNELSLPFQRMYHAPSFVTFSHMLCCALWALIVWSFFGAAISRLAAVTFARQENTSLKQLAQFVSPRWSAYFVAPLFPLVGSFLIAALMAVVGFAMRSDWGVVAASIIWPAVLLGGFMMAFLLLGLFFGFPLMWGAVSAEGTDAFGALSHSYSYVYQRPMKYLLYAIIAGLAGLLGWYLVCIFATLVFELAYWGISWGAGHERLDEVFGPRTLGKTADTGTLILYFWNNCLRTLAFGYIFSYFWTSTTIIYFLLRRSVDATELDEVYLLEKSARHGLPPLKTGPDGVPSVVDEPAAVNATSSSQPAESASPPAAAT